MIIRNGSDSYPGKMLSDSAEHTLRKESNMPTYQNYPAKKDTPSRKARKAARTKIFLTNKGLATKLRRERKLAREAAAEALESTEE
jgi:hypothetical protein